jgi:sodium transport system ATP-binding protein
MIKCDGLAKAFQRPGARRGEAPVAAVQDVSLAAEDGEITGLLGPNGAGKSTTLRMLTTLVVPDAGSASIDGHDVVTEVEAARRNLGYMPHDAGIYPRLTARENIHYYARLCGLSATTAQQRTGELVEQLAMASFADRRAAGFSQGQKTKVALGRALVHSPRNLMLDEPTNGLDVMATRGLREIVRNLADRGHCIVFSSHVMQEVSALCDRIAIIAEGRIAMADTLPAILTHTGQTDLEDAFVSVLRLQPEEEA